MTTITLEVEDSKVGKFLEQLKNFEYVRLKKKSKQLSTEDKRILASLERSVEELNLARQGKIELQDAFQMIREVKSELEMEGFYED